MTTNKKAKHHPFIHLSKRDGVSAKTALLIRVIAIVAAFLLTGLVAVIISGANPFKVYLSMFEGNFDSTTKILTLFQEVAILLCISLAVTPAFKMKFWNCGAEGQVLVGGLSTAAVMFYASRYEAARQLEEPLYQFPRFPLFVMMIVGSIVAGLIWALIPALFKAKWNTNETLFTLMMNYIAIQLVNVMILVWDKSGSAILRPMYDHGLPKLFGQRYLLNIVIVALLTAALYIYLKKSKQGYEIAVVGESKKTAKYIGINVGKVIIRTVAISGAICGLAGLLLVGGTNYTINADTAGGQGFTAIIVSWLAKFNPIYMVLTSFLITFLNKGTAQICSDSDSWGKSINVAYSDIVTAIMLLFIIGCEFFINYKIHFNFKHKENTEEKEETV